MVEVRQYIGAANIKGANKKALTKIGAQIVAHAKSLSPVLQGSLRNSIMYKTDSTSGGFNDSPGEPAQNEITIQPQENELYVGSNLEYAIYQEFGTRKMAARPYLRPAIFAIMKGKYDDIVKAEIDKETAKGKLTPGTKIRRFF